MKEKGKGPRIKPRGIGRTRGRVNRFYSRQGGLRGSWKSREEKLQEGDSSPLVETHSRCSINVY